MRRLSTTAMNAVLVLMFLLTAPAPPAQANPDGPVISFGGRRFAVTRGFEAFESIAFDPINRHIASAGEIRTRRGELVSAGPTESPGLAWDAVTNSYWQITNDRRVRRWVGNQVVQEVFTIPQIFNVPGTGPDTLCVRLRFQSREPLEVQPDRGKSHPGARDRDPGPLGPYLRSATGHALGQSGSEFEQPHLHGGPAKRRLHYGSGRLVPSGSYWVRLRAGADRRVTRVVWVR